MTVSGPDAQKMVSMSVINDCYNWKIGHGKHLVMCNEEGLINCHALVNRTAEDTFVVSAAVPWPWVLMIQSGEYDVKTSSRDILVCQIAGPKSLTLIEELTPSDQHDLKCLEFRTVHIPSLDLDVLLERGGMAGTLSYELRCDSKDSARVYDAVYQLGKAKYDMKRLGWRTYTVNHTEAAHPKRTIVTLKGNTEDVIDIYASQFRDGEPYKYMEMPSAPQQPTGDHADRVLSLNGRLISVSSCAIYSAYYHRTISHCTIDIDQSEIGNDVIIEWGEFGGRIKQVRAKVARYPYLDLVRNEKYNMSTVPHGWTGQ